MNEILTTSNIVFVLGLLGVMFGVYHYFRNPQIKSDKIEAIFTLQLTELQKTVTNLRDNHIHSIELKIDGTKQQLADLSVQVGKLATIIEERVPKRIQ